MMKITILNGNPEPSSFDSYLAELKSSLETNGNDITQLDLRKMKLRYCIGCWGCWAKTPGECSSQDASLEMDRVVINSDFTLWAAPLKMGFPSTLLKMALDKHIPLIHPYMEVVHNEAHHLKRYERYPRLGLLIETEAGTDEKDARIVTDIFSRTALNFKSRLEFSLTTETPVMDVAERILSSTPTCLPLPKRLPATQGVTITPPKRLTLFNGSPRGRKGNTPIFLREIAAGFDGPSETYHLVRMRETEQMVSEFADAECVILGLPLYTDAMPGVVKNFIEALEPLTERADNPPIGFVVQSGFPEGLHSRYVERYLEKLAERLGSPYLGTVVKGNGEGTRIMPDNMNEKLFANLQAIGSALAVEGHFDVEALTKIAHPERFPKILGPVFKVFLRTSVAHSYFDNMLKENGAYEKRFARPFMEGS
jgi:multimeric flavodoxin WrbA